MHSREQEMELVILYNSADRQHRSVMLLTVSAFIIHLVDLEPNVGLSSNSGKSFNSPRLHSAIRQYNQSDINRWSRGKRDLGGRKQWR